ncbi:MAG TPA: HAMP domain-containing sensor histidine kinase, partial [Phycisphaerae bacterium]|nr:HAMP domain-containing sensor histidine kinase [Phycisphaerae bacterium]
GRCSNEELSERSPAAGGRVPSGGDWVYVTVKDTGIGMDSNGFVSGEDSVTGWVFDAFRRGNRALESGIAGTGLGLSIVREVVEQGGGQIRVHSQPGQGSTFQVMFPARPVGGEDAGLAVRSTRSSSVVIDRDAPDQPGETAPPSGGAG